MRTLNAIAVLVMLGFAALLVLWIWSHSDRWRQP